MAVPASLSFHLSSSQRSQRCSMPYRSGGHSTAAAISALGGESNYIDGPRRRRPPPVSLLTPPLPSSQPSTCIHPLSSPPLRFMHPDAYAHRPPCSLLTSLRSCRCPGRFSAIATALRHGRCCLYNFNLKFCVGINGIRKCCHGKI